MARPTKYSQDILIASENYLENYAQTGDVIPSIEGLADVLGVVRSTIYAWAKEHDEFSNITEGIHTRQARCLINRGLDGTYSTTALKAMLGKHGYSDKYELEHTGRDGGPIETSISINWVDASKST